THVPQGPLPRRRPHPALPRRARPLAQRRLPRGGRVMSAAPAPGSQTLLSQQAALAREPEEAARRPIQWALCKRLFRYSWRYPRLQVIIIAQALIVAIINASVPLI